MAETQHLSRAAYDRLRAEHEDLTTRGRIDIARKIEAARELGDLSENGDYHAAKEEQGKMEGRIIHLSRMVENAEDLDVISPGSPLGEALIGRTAGDTVAYETPTGARLEVEITAVEG